MRDSFYHPYRDSVPFLGCVGTQRMPGVNPRAEVEFETVPHWNEGPMRRSTPLKWLFPFGLLLAAALGCGSSTKAPVEATMVYYAMPG